MGKAIGEILPFALGAAISVIPIIAIILMLVTPKAKANGTSFAAGFVAGLALICIVAVVLAGGSNYSSSSGPTKTVSTIKLLLGLLLLLAAFRQWRARPKPGEEPTMPKWLASIDQFTPARSFGIGAALSTVNPKNLAMSLAAGLSIAQAGLSTGQEAGTILIYVALAGATILGPLIVYLVMGQPLSVNVRRDAHHRGINDLEGENGERRTCWSRVRMELGLRLRLPAATRTSEA